MLESLSLCTVGSFPRERTAGVPRVRSAQRRSLKYVSSRQNTQLLFQELFEGFLLPEFLWCDSVGSGFVVRIVVRRLQSTQ